MLRCGRCRKSRGSIRRWRQPRWHNPGHGVRVQGQVPGERLAGVDGQAGARQAAEAERRQPRRLYTLIVETDPRQLGSSSPPYAREMVREQIRREFGMRLPAVSVRRPPRRPRPPPQRPLRQAWQAGPAAAARWLAEELPAIRAYLCPRLTRSSLSARLSPRGKGIVNPRSRSKPDSLRTTPTPPPQLALAIHHPDHRHGHRLRLGPAIDQGTRTPPPGRDPSGTASQGSDPARAGQQVHAQDNALNSATRCLRPCGNSSAPRSYRYERATLAR